MEVILQNTEKVDHQSHLGLVAQSCVTLCNPMDCSPPGSLAHRIFQARTWSGVPFTLSGDFSNSGIKPGSPALQADSLAFEPPRKPQSMLLIWDRGWHSMVYRPNLTNLKHLLHGPPQKKIIIPLSRLKRKYKEFGKNVLELKKIQYLEKYQRK